MRSGCLKRLRYRMFWKVCHPHSRQWMQSQSSDARIANITETVIVGTNGIMTGRYIISQLSTNRIPMIIAVEQRGKKNE